VRRSGRCRGGEGGRRKLGRHGCSLVAGVLIIVSTLHLSTCIKARDKVFRKQSDESWIIATFGWQR
jgi:hypothetical protein